MKEKKVLIIGGGFAGIETAKKLAKIKIPNLKIQLISDRYHFEYTPLLYRVVIGRNPLEVCIPLSDIFNDKKVSVDIDTIIGISPDKNQAFGSSGLVYDFDYAVLALGSETIFFGIDGMKENSFSFKSIDEALRLKNHLHRMVEENKKSKILEYFRIVIVGGGPSGVELAGEISSYLKKILKFHGISKEKAEIILIEAGPRILPIVSEKISEVAKKKLESLGVKVLLNKKVIEARTDCVLLDNEEIKTKTIIWASGIRPKEFYATIPNIQKDKSGRVLTNEQLSIEDHNNIFVVGDGAKTLYSGMAQTAISDGAFVADVIALKILDKSLPKYKPKKVGYSIPIGPNWAIFYFKPFYFFGFLGWLMRKLIDLRYMMKILPWWKAFIAVKSNGKLCESCKTCTKLMKDYV